MVECKTVGGLFCKGSSAEKKVFFGQSFQKMALLTGGGVGGWFRYFRWLSWFRWSGAKKGKHRDGGYKGAIGANVRGGEVNGIVLQFVKL